MAVPALDAFVHPGLQFHFVANVDGHDITPVLWHLKPAETLFIVASKTFTTQETMTNARRARAWFIRTAAPTPPRALLSRHHHQREGGCRVRHQHHLRLLGLGGRALLAVERDRPAAGHRHRRREFPRPAGRRARDGPPFRRTRRWRRTCRRCSACSTSGTAISTASRAQRGRPTTSTSRLPAYLQQLEMESNGKRVDLDGASLFHGTSPVV